MIDAVWPVKSSWRWAAPFLKYGPNLSGKLAVTEPPTAPWPMLTWLTRPSRPETLKRFYRKVHPGGPGWRPIAKLCPDVKPEGLGRLLICWGLGSVFIFAAMFGIGALVLGEMRLGGWVVGRPVGGIFLGLAVLCAAAFFILYPRGAKPAGEQKKG